MGRDHRCRRQCRAPWESGELVEAPDAEAEVGFRFRTGTDEDPYTYHTYTGLANDIKVVERSEWETLRPRIRTIDPEDVDWQGPVIKDRENWSGWTASLTALGTRLELPSGQFFQLQVEMRSGRPTDMARLDSLSIEILPLLVPTLVGEVGLAHDPLSANLAQVPLGEPVAFTYAICARFEGADHEGFDTVRIATPAGPEFLRLRMGAPLEEMQPDSVRSEADGLTLYLPRRVEADEEMRIGLKTTLYTVSTELRGEVFNREERALLQRVKAGDATDEIRTNRLQVVAEGGQERTLEHLAIQPRTLTPNGDGINDHLWISYTLFGVTDAEVEIALYTLSGERIHRLVLPGQGAGNHRVEWAGIDALGHVLPPGLYLCQVAAMTGQGRSEQTRSISVAY